MEVIATGIEGLTLVLEDTRATYTKNGNELLLDGEWQSGEAWIGNTWYSYERIAGDIVVFEDTEGVERYRFEDSEEGWEQFADSVL